MAVWTAGEDKGSRSRSRRGSFVALPDRLADATPSASCAVSSRDAGFVPCAAMLERLGWPQTQGGQNAGKGRGGTLNGTGSFRQTPLGRKGRQVSVEPGS